MQITLIIGLPGSGKSTYTKENFPNNLIIDDPKSLNDLPDTTDDFIIVDPWLCDPKIRDKCISHLVDRYNCKIETVYFENNPRYCWSNIFIRVLDGDTRNVKITFDMLKNVYRIPENNNIIPVWRG